MSDQFVIPVAVSELLREYRSNKPPTAVLSTSTIDNKLTHNREFVGSYVSTSKDTCVEFVQALMQYNRSLEVTTSEEEEDVALSLRAAPVGNDTESSSVSKKLNGVVMIDDTMVLFLNCPVSKTSTGTSAGSTNTGVDTSSSVVVSNVPIDITSNTFMNEGRYVNWCVDASAVVRENSASAGKLRSLLLQGFTQDVERIEDSGDGDGDNGGDGGLQKTVLLFVRQNAAPYVYCGQVRVVSLVGQVSNTLSSGQLPLSTVVALNTTTSTTTTKQVPVVADRNTSVIAVNWELVEYDSVMREDPVTGSESEYKQMIRKNGFGV